MDFEGSLPDGTLRALIDHSYALVVNGLPGKMRALLNAGADDNPGKNKIA